MVNTCYLIISSVIFQVLSLFHGHRQNTVSSKFIGWMDTACKNHTFSSKISSISDIDFFPNKTRSSFITKQGTLMILYLSFNDL